MMPLSLEMLRHILPILILSGAAVLLMLLIAFVRSHIAAVLLSMAALVAAFVAVSTDHLSLIHMTTAHITPLLSVDSMTQYYWALILFSGFICVGISYTYVSVISSFREEWYLLLLVATAGALVLTASDHFMALFIGLELLSVPLYGLAAFALKHKPSLEAGLKYLVLSALASAFLLFGIALIYADTGSLVIVSQLSALSQSASPLVIGACGLILVGLGFKLSWVPFHAWTADVYQGAPMPVATFLATASKVAVVAAVVKITIGFSLLQQEHFIWLFILISGLSILLGNLLAMKQVSLKRLLAYSSIAHFGYLLIASLAGNLSAVWLYLVTYVLASLGAFSVLTALTRMGSEAQGDDFSALRGLGRRHPFLGSALAVSMLSLAGIPLTAGFIGKFFVLAAGVNQSQWILLIIAVLGSSIGIYYYLRVVSLLFQANTAMKEDALASVSIPHGILIAGLVGLTMIVGIWPGLLL